jgi:ligand-binding sensor domain-containing protein
MLLPCALLALDPTKSIYQLNCATWTRQNGLPANGINAITQTRDGFLWLGTQKGLVRFDGVEFKTLDLVGNHVFRNNIVLALAGSEKGGVWFGLANGAFGFYSEAAGLAPAPGDPWIRPTTSVNAIHEARDGSLWLGAEEWTARWADGKTNQTRYFPELQNGMTIYEGQHGRVWLGTFRAHAQTTSYDRAA